MIIILFLLVNTTYYWEGELEFLPFSLTLLLVTFDVGLIIIFVREFFFAYKESFEIKYRIVTIGILSIGLIISFCRQYKLLGISDFQSKELLTGMRGFEGPNSNCITTIKFNSNYTFQERNLCNGISMVKGTYRISDDTIYFQEFNKGKKEDVKYDFAVIEKQDFYTENEYALVLYKNKKDKNRFLYWLGGKENELSIKPSKKPNG